MNNVFKELCGKEGKYTVKQIAELLGVTCRTVYNIREKGKLPWTDYSGQTEYWKLINEFDKSFTKTKLLGK